MAFVLFLAHPLYAVATVLCAFLVFAAAGSWLTERWQKKMANSRYVTLAVMVMGVLSLLYLAILPGLFQAPPFTQCGKNNNLRDASRASGGVHGNTLPCRHNAAGICSPGRHSLGMGDQRLRLGGRGSPCYLTGNSSGIFRGSPASYPDLRFSLCCLAGVRSSRLVLK